MDPSTVSVQGVPALFGGVGAGVVATSVSAPADATPEAVEARRRRLAVVGVSLMGAAAVSTAVFQTVTGTSTTIAMTSGLSAFLGATSTPTPQGPLLPLPAPAISDLGLPASVPTAAQPSEVALRAAQGPLAGPGELPDASRSAAPLSAGSGGGGAPASSDGRSGAGQTGPSAGHGAGGWSGGHGSGSTSPGSSTTRTSDPSSTSPTTPPRSDTPTTPPSSGTTTPPKSDAPTTPPKSDPPKSDPPKSDPPKSDPPKSDPPKVETPKSDPPKVDPPKVETPKSSA